VRVPTTLAGKIAAIVAAAIVVVLGVSQLFLPGIGENAIEDRLTENGGVADASLSAMPAARLLWGSGDRIGIDANGLDLEVSRADDPVVFDDLDRFDDVEIVIRDSSLGPVDMDNFVLTREGDDPYSLEGTGTTSVADLAEFGAEEFAPDLPGVDILGGILNVATGGTEIDVDMDMKVESDDGRVRVVEGGGEIAGIPTGPLAAFITSAVTVEL
jgi:hypothetical protein